MKIPAVQILLLLGSQICSVLSNTPIVFDSEWGWGESTWTLVLQCDITLDKDYNPNETETGFFIQLDLEEQAIDVATAHYPFDVSEVKVTDMTTTKEYKIPTLTNVWEYRGDKTYTITVTFDNPSLTKTGNWPNGTCSGPFPLTSF